MDKRVILAVAGSGKSKLIIDKINENSRALFITYTELNAKQLKERIIRKIGYLPKGIKVYTYFSFIYSFCFKPLYVDKLQGINFENNYTRYVKKEHRNFWFDNNNRVYSNRIARFIIEIGILEEVLARISKYFDLVCVDEIQDFSGNDFNFICYLNRLDCEVLFVGDFFQHTFDTSRDGNINKNLHLEYTKYCQRFVDVGFEVDLNLLSNSYRCSASVCDFVDKKLGITISSQRVDSVEVKLLEDEAEIIRIYQNKEVVKLFYKNSSKYLGNTANWGAVKGADDYQDVCVVLNNTTFKNYQSNTLLDLVPSTKNKLYVACTRAKGNLYFIEEKKLQKIRDNKNER